MRASIRFAVAAFLCMAMIMPASSSLAPAGSVRADGALATRVMLEAPVALDSPARIGNYVLAGQVPASDVLSTTITVDLGGSASPLAQYLASDGLTVTDPVGTIVWLLRGTTQAFERAFSTSLSYYTGPDGSRYAAFTQVPTLPAGMPGVAVAEPDGPNPMMSAIGAHGAAPSTLVNSVACPAASNGILGPSQVQSAYNITPVLKSGIKGQNETIGIVDVFDSAEPESRIVSDLSQFSTCNSIPQPNITFAYPVPGGNMNNTSSSGWGLETALDTQYSHATAPDARILLALAPNSAYGLYFAVDWMVATGNVDVISLSWGEPESGIYNLGPCSFQCNASSDGSMATLGPVFAEAAARGIDVFVATGDCGANGGTPSFAPWYPASDPHAIGVGGTVLTVAANGGYGSEGAWNGTETYCSNGGGSGGGFSSLPRPWWQSGPGFGRFTNSTRGVPDVAFTAGTPLEMIYNGSTVYVEGTSDAAPEWAGLGALIAQAEGGGVPGFLPPELYSILSTGSYTKDFHPIVAGNNGYTAGFGWDPVTGIGTPDFAPLLATIIANKTQSITGPGNLLLTASPMSGVAPEQWDPLQVNLSATPWPDTEVPLRYQFYHGDVGQPYGEANATTTNDSWADIDYDSPGAYDVFAVGYGAGANASMTNPLVINVGNGGPLSVGINANSTNTTAGSPVVLSASASGGNGPYHFAYFFGDGTYDLSLGDDGPSTTHTYAQNGSYLVTVIANDSSNPLRGGLATVCVDVGNVSGTCPSIPKVPSLEVSPLNATLRSNGSTVVFLNATFNGLPLSGAIINVSAAHGQLSKASVITNSSGEAQVEFTAPDVGQTIQFGIYANLSLKGYAVGEGNVLVIVNPTVGPSLVPSIYISQERASSGSSVGLVISTAVAVSGVIIPNATVGLDSTLGTVSMPTDMVNSDGQLVASVRLPITKTNLSGRITANVSYPGFTTDTSEINFTVVPSPQAFVITAHANTSTIPSMASTLVYLSVTNQTGGPVGSNLSGIKSSAGGGTFSLWSIRSATVYEVYYSAPVISDNATEILSFNFTGGPEATTLGNAVALVNVTWGHGGLNITLSSNPPMDRPKGVAVLTVTVSSKVYGTTLDGVLVVIGTTSGQGTLSEQVVWTNALGDFSVNYTAPNRTGNFYVNITAIGFVYRLTSASFLENVSVPPPPPSNPAQFWTSEGDPVIIASLAMLAGVTVIMTTRRKPEGGQNPNTPKEPDSPDEGHD